MTAVQILVGDALTRLRDLPDESVQMCVTSPPYWGLRDYSACACVPQRVQDESSTLDGSQAGTPNHRGSPQPECPECHGTGRHAAVATQQLGMEATPEDYVAHLVEVFREVRRVLRKDGTVWLNLGDSYAGSGRVAGGSSPIQENNRGTHFDNPLPRVLSPGLKAKDLVGIPWMVAFALQADGWYLRSDIIWHKNSTMPESVTDRPTRSHEYLFLLAKSKTYYYDADAIREPLAASTLADPRNDTGRHTSDGKWATAEADQPSWYRQKVFVDAENGRNARDVWTLSPANYADAHFATFPEELVIPPIKAGTSEQGACVECGASAVRQRTQINPQAITTGRNPGQAARKIQQGHLSTVQSPSIGQAEVGVWKTTGWTTPCSHTAARRPCVVLDPFGGAGTTGLVAAQLGRDAILIELNPAYADMARDRIESEVGLLTTVTVDGAPEAVAA